MKKLVPMIMVLTAIISTCLLLTQCSSRPKTQTLKFATEATYAPFAFMQANGQITGFGTDIVHAVCRQMRKKCELINAPFDSLIPSLQLGKYDALFGGLQITPSRKKVVNFSHNYYDDTVTFVIKKQNNFTIDTAGLKDKIIGVQVGTTYAQYLQQKYGKEITLKTYASDMNAFLDLKEGRIDAVFTDKPVGITWIKKQKSQQFITKGNIIDHQLFGQGYGFAIRKGNTKLLHSINQALTTIKENGEYTKIVNKWFDH